MLQRLRESLALVLIALLPFHALIVTVLTKWIMGAGHAPMGEIAIWKEGMLAIILLLAVIEIAMSGKRLAVSKPWKIDWIDALILLLLALGIIVSISYKLQATSFIYGVRYDFIPLIAFIILRRVLWSDQFLKRVMNVLLWSGVIIAVYGIIGFFLPASFFTWLGYNDLHSLYLPDGPLAPFQQIGGTSIRRIQSVMSGPNQLGLWLLLPIGIATSYGLRASRIARSSQLLVLVAALVLTFSRAAWIGAAVIIGINLWPLIRSLSRRATAGIIGCAACCLLIIIIAFPSIILRAASSRGHIENPLKAVQMMIDHPFGLGLGTAGPASNRTSDACVMLEEGSDVSWAKDRPNLCVFVGGNQVQPTDRNCHCPFLPENWYLQIGVEMGWLGLIVYLALTVFVLRKLYELREERGELRVKAILNSQFSIFVGLSLAALFLHAWEDSAAAYTVWILIASQLPAAAFGSHVKRSS